VALGLHGLILAAPLTVCLVVLGKYVPEMEFIQVLMGDEPVLETDVSYYQRLLARDQDEAGEIVEGYLKEHSREDLYDAVLVPALTYVRRDRERDRATEDDEEFALRATREIAEEIAPLGTTTGVGDAAPVEESFASGRKVLVIGCPARGEADKLALLMFRRLLESMRCEIEVLSPEMLSAEIVAAVEERDAAVVCIAALPPGGLAQRRYLCKRLRQRLPDLRILVGRWGLRGNAEENRALLLAAGADAVGTTLLESRTQLSQTLQLIPPAPSVAVPDPDPSVAQIGREAVSPA